MTEGQEIINFKNVIAYWEQRAETAKSDYEAALEMVRMNKRALKVSENERALFLAPQPDTTTQGECLWPFSQKMDRWECSHGSYSKRTCDDGICTCGKKIVYESIERISPDTTKEG